MKEMKNKCNRCGEIGHFGTKCPSVVQFARCIRCKNVGHEWNNCPNFPLEKKVRKQKEQFEVEEQWKNKYNFVKYVLKNLPRNSIEESMKYIPGYGQKVYEAMKKYQGQDEINLIEKEGRPKIIPVTCEANIQGVETEVIIDSGAAVSVITKELADQIPYEMEPSRTRLIPFGNEKFASLGIIKNMEFFIGDTRTKATVEVVDLQQQANFLLGTDWLEKEKGIIDMEQEELRLKRGINYESIPMKYEEEEMYEQEYEDEEVYY